MSTQHNLKVLHCPDGRKVFINEIEIDETIFVEETIDYSLTYREDRIDDLIQWIADAQSQLNFGMARPSAESDIMLMKADLKQLMNLEDEYVFDSFSTNKFIAASENPERFDELCEAALMANDDLKAGKGEGEE